MNGRKILCLLLSTCLLASCAHQPYSPSAQQSPTPADRNPTASRKEKPETPWTTWDEKGTVGGLLVLSHIRDNLLKNNLHDPHIDYSGNEKVNPVQCKGDATFRTADGTCYHSKTPYVGAAGVAFGRNVPPQFIDQEANAKLMEPKPELVSEVFFTREEIKPVPFLNMLAAVWIQFMNHDWLTHGKNEVSNPFHVKLTDGSSATVDRTQVNPAGQSQYKREFGNVTLNDVTHWWDASQIYGSSQMEQNLVRSFSHGKMRTVLVNGNEILPKDDKLNPRNNRQNQGYEVTGFRDNWWIGLSLLHTLFTKEHNSIAEDLYKKHVVGFDERTGMYKWESKWKYGVRKDKETLILNAQQLDEKIFQTARLVNSALLAKIHTVEWTPAILPNPVLIRAMCTNWYGIANKDCRSGKLGQLPKRTVKLDKINAGYMLGGIVGDKRKDYGAPFSITEEFTAVYRLHSLIPDTLQLRRLASKDNVDNVRFQDTRNDKSYAFMESYGLKDLYYSFGTQLPGQLVLNNFPRFMQNLEIPGHGKMDLGMVDIIRDRERGVPRYNQFRRAIGLNPIESYNDFFSVADLKKMQKEKPEAVPAEMERRRKVIEKFERVYGKDANGNDNVELVDLLVGTLAEEDRPSSYGFGETMFQIFILMASRRLMADKFFTDYYSPKYYTQTGIDWVDGETFGTVISRHMPELAPHVKGLSTAFYPWNK